MLHSLLPGDHTPHASGLGFPLFTVNGSEQVGGGREQLQAGPQGTCLPPGGRKFAFKAGAHAHTYTHFRIQLNRCQETKQVTP